jgi:hypothetical protein
MGECMRAPSAPFDATPDPSGPDELSCPQCPDTDLLPLGRVFADRSGVCGPYRCRRCTTKMWLPTARAMALPEAP